MKQMLSCFALASLLLNANTATAITITNQKQISSEEAEFATIKQKLHSTIQKAEKTINIYDELFYEKQREEWKKKFYQEFRLTHKHVALGSKIASNDNAYLYNDEPSHNQQGNVHHMHLLTTSSLTAYEINSFLSKTAMKDLGRAFVKAELESGVNAAFLVSLAVHESGWGTSKIAKNKKNLFGYGAYDSSPYQSAMTFSSYESGIVHVAKKLRESYLVQNGKFYSGASLYGVNKRYSTDKNWSKKIASTMVQLDNHAMKIHPKEYEVKF